MKKLTQIILFVLLLTPVFLLYKPSSIYAQQCGRSCESSTDCDSGTVCQNNVCVSYCTGYLAAPDTCQVEVNNCDVPNNYVPETRLTPAPANCSCQCVNTNVRGRACVNDSGCDPGYWCVNGYCYQATTSCSPCTTNVAGEHGACTAFYSCPSGWGHPASPPCPLQEGNICCVDPLIAPSPTPTPTPIAGAGCLEDCTTTSCRTGLHCDTYTLNRCWGNYPPLENECPLCTGLSRVWGICGPDGGCGDYGLIEDGSCPLPYHGGSGNCCVPPSYGTPCLLQPTPASGLGHHDINLYDPNSPNTTFSIQSHSNFICNASVTTDSSGNRLFSCEALQWGSYTVTASTSVNPIIMCSIDITIGPTGSEGRCDDLCETRPIGPYGFCVQGNVNWPTCHNYLDDCTIPVADCWCCPNENPQNTSPFPSRNPLSPQGSCGEGSIGTAIGCLPVGDKNAFLAFILRWALGISGGVSFILIIYSGFTIMTSGGDKRKLQSGKELLTAALSGLILIIFSVFILDFIGIRILRIPGL